MCEKEIVQEFCGWGRYGRSGTEGSKVDGVWASIWHFGIQWSWKIEGLSCSLFCTSLFVFQSFPPCPNSIPSDTRSLFSTSKNAFESITVYINPYVTTSIISLPPPWTAPSVPQRHFLGWCWWQILICQLEETDSVISVWQREDSSVSLGAPVSSNPMFLHPILDWPPSTLLALTATIWFTLTSTLVGDVIVTALAHPKAVSIAHLLPIFTITIHNRCLTNGGYPAGRNWGFK